MKPLVSTAVALSAVFLITYLLAEAGNPPGIPLILLLYLLAFGLTQWLWSRIFEQDCSEAASAAQWPVSGPVARLGPRAVEWVFGATAFLSFLNPFQGTQQIRHMVGQSKAARRLRTQDNMWPQSHMQTEKHATKSDSDCVPHYATDYRLPFDGEWIVANGGPTESTSHSWDVLNQRYAYDFVKVDENLSRHRNHGTRLTDYYCYGEPILAAADGEVIEVRDGIRPSPAVGFALADIFCRDFRGNYIVIRHAEAEYGFYAHLQRGSLSVKHGDSVTAGEELGLCGHSGHSTEPHLHFHVQDRPDFFTALSVPVRFGHCRVDSIKVSEAVLSEGQRVANVDVVSPVAVSHR